MEIRSAMGTRLTVKQQPSGSWAVFEDNGSRKSLFGTYASEELARKAVDTFLVQKYGEKPDAKVIPFDPQIKQASLFGDD